MVRMRVLCAVMIVIWAPAVTAANAPSIPDPYGLGPRLALIDYLENTLHATVQPGTSYEDLVASYWTLVDKPKTDADAERLDHIRQLQFTLKSDFGIDASAITDEAVLAARLKQCEGAATISLTETRPDPVRPAAAAASDDPSDAPGWLTDYQEAVKQSRAANRPILIDFSGSDWCMWCIRLHREVFSQDAFRTWAAQHVVLLMADFPSTPLPPALAKQNEQLVKTYDIHGFPTVLILSADGKVLGRSGYEAGGAKAWIDTLVSQVPELR